MKIIHTPEGDVHIKRLRNARRMSLRISSLDRKITLTAPSFVRDREADAFLTEKRDWVRTQLQTIPAPRRAADCTAIDIQGHRFSIIPSANKSAELDHDTQTLHVPLAAERRGPAIAAMLKGMARQTIVAQSDHYSALLGEPYSRITLRDTRSRWGSCSEAGNLMFSWRLIMAPPQVLSYVVAHEVSHLKFMDHSKAFWGTVESIFPDFRKCQSWLKKNGQNLHKIDFRN